MSNDGSGGYDPDHERVQENSKRRRHDRTETVEGVIGDVGMLDESKYPATSEELAVEYADEELDLVNETESLGSVFDRLVDERFETPADAREAVLNELTGEAGGDAESSDGRDLRTFEDDEERL